MKKIISIFDPITMEESYKEIEVKEIKEKSISKDNKALVKFLAEHPPGWDWHAAANAAIWDDIRMMLR